MHTVPDHIALVKAIQRDHRIEANLVPESATIRADPDQVGQIFWNLARNALQAMPDGGRLDISTARNGDDLIFTVSDSGPGLPEEIRDSLFDPFVTSGKEEGTGLGLAIVKQAVRDHSGTIDVETGSERGTTFTITLPFDTKEGRESGKDKKMAKEAR